MSSFLSYCFVGFILPDAWHEEIGIRGNLNQNFVAKSKCGAAWWGCHQWLTIFFGKSLKKSERLQRTQIRNKKTQWCFFKGHNRHRCDYFCSTIGTEYFEMFFRQYFRVLPGFGAGWGPLWKETIFLALCHHSSSEMDIGVKIVRCTHTFTFRHTVLLVQYRHQKGKQKRIFWWIYDLQEGRLQIYKSHIELPDAIKFGPTIGSSKPQEYMCHWVVQCKFWQILVSLQFVYKYMWHWVVQCNIVLTNIGFSDLQEVFYKKKSQICPKQVRISCKFWQILVSLQFIAKNARLNCLM